MSEQANKARHAARVQAIYKLLVCAASNHDIMQFVAAQGAKYRAEKDRAKKGGMDPWGIHERQIYTLIAEARQLFRAKLNEDLDEIKGRSLARREYLFQSSVKLQDFGKALAVEQDTCKLLDLYPKKKLEITHEIDDSALEGYTTEELFSLLSDLKAKQAALTAGLSAPTRSKTDPTKQG